MGIKYYELVERETPEPGEFTIQTAALISCGLCGEMIDGMGGPGRGPVCKRCGDLLDNGRLRGTVKWPDQS